MSVTMETTILKLDQVDQDFIYAGSEDTKIRILILEDLETDAQLLQLQLRKVNQEKEILHVTNKEDFIKAFDEYKPQMILSDYALPQFTGMEALLFVRERNPYIPFIICTGSVNEETAVACIKAGADDYVLKDSMGRLSSAVENAIQAKTNLVEKERAISNLESSEANFRALAENAPDNIYKLDRNGTIHYVSRSVDGVERDQVIGKSIYDFMSEPNKKRLEDAMKDVFDDGQIAAIDIEGNPNDPESQWYLCRLAPVVADGQIDSAVFIPSNITARVQAEREMKELNEKLQALTQHLENIRDEEKEKIAMEIHDQLGQELTGNKLGLFWIKQILEKEELQAEDKTAAIEKVDYLVDLTTTTIQTVRRIAHELRPVVLDNMGLVAAMEWHVDNYNKHHSIQCRLHIDVNDATFEKEFSTAIYRIMQEGLTNINRHSEASQSWVDFLIAGDELVLEIRDNGKGLEIDKALKSKSLGLFGMRERIKAWNGQFDLESEKGKGTTIRLQFDMEHLSNSGAIFL
ncbi:hybrid sensor histidine kinase/response regulator [Sanyastnella coralliicola]|uniref:hybrid sensor histidine kinase/response regulator n=1 Tax=Sanyastnella coralliicola TaxID=3069118 RepID=UPI0027B92DDD|nr:response regulator [Longitalea sp. SCSIO 12813]